MKKKIIAALSGIVLALGLTVAVAPAANAAPNDCMLVSSSSARIWIVGDNGHVQYYYPGTSTCGVAYVNVSATQPGYSGYWCIRFDTPTFTSRYCGSIWVDIPPGTTLLTQYWVAT